MRHPPDAGEGKARLDGCSTMLPRNDVLDVKGGQRELAVLATTAGPLPNQFLKRLLHFPHAADTRSRDCRARDWTIVRKSPSIT